jgi:tetratricopeptide (TPR) repeat protein
LSTTPTDPLVGSTVAHYGVVAKLGGGGMGVVYKAIDSKLGRTVALKFLPPQWSHDEGAKQRFMREAQAASATNHRNICVIHDIDHTDDGRLFIVMAYYEGETLKQRLERGTPPIGEALEIATEVAEGLAKARAQGVVHRDIKPGNLILTDDGVKILDFGLAKFADALQLTIPGSTIGTSGYMSPEQARGEEADARSDVWALGVVMYEMLTGEVPFKGAYPEAIFYAIKTEPVPPLRAQGREISEALETIVLRALEKDPDKRYQTARELARDLRLLLGRTVPVDLMTGPLPSSPLLATPKSRLRWQRMRAAATPGRVVAAAVLIVAAAVGSYMWFTRPVVRIPVAIAPVANRTGETDLDSYRLALTHALIDELTESPNIRIVPYLRLIEILRRFTSSGSVSNSEATQAIATRSGTAVMVLPTLEYQNGALLARAQFRNAETGTTMASFVTAPVSSTLPQETAYRLMADLAEGIQAYFKANGPGRSYAKRPAARRLRTLEAVRSFEQGLSDYEQLEYSDALAAFERAAVEDSQHPLIQAWLSRVYLILNKTNEAVAAARRAKQLMPNETPRSDSSFIEAILAEALGDSVAAGSQYKEFAGLQRDQASAQAELADFLKRQNQNQPAVEAYREALRIDSGYVRLRVDLCQLYVRLNEYPLAQEQAMGALEQYRGADNRAGEAQALLCLGDLQRAEGQLDDARRNIEAARDIFETIGRPYGLSRVYQYLGTVATAANDFPTAARFFEESLARSRPLGNRQLEGLELMNLGVTYQNLGQRDQALRYYRESHDVYQQIGNEQRAAEQEINSAYLIVTYGGGTSDALRRLRIARATLEKLGLITHDVHARQVEATSYLYSGQHEEARRQLRAAMTLAEDKKLTNRLASLKVKLAESYFVMSEYESAKTELEEVLANEPGRTDLEAQVALGRVYTRLGDFDAARRHLDPALAAVRASGYLELAPIAYLSLGELAYMSGAFNEAGTHFLEAETFWTEDLPDAASVEAKCYLGLLDAQSQRSPGARGRLATSVAQANKMGRPYLETRCRLNLARLDISQHRYADAVAALQTIPSDGERSIGLELQAQVNYWRGLALAGQRDQAAAASQDTLARTLMERLKNSLASSYRHGFTSRSDIRPVLAQNSVREAR